MTGLMASDATSVNRRGLTISADRVTHIYPLEGHDVVALSSVDLHVAAGHMVAVVGPSGSGKSTLLALLAGLQTPSAGHLTVGSHDLSSATQQDRDRLRATEVGTVLQGAQRNLLPYATVGQNVAFAQRPARRYGSDPPPTGEVLDLVGIASLHDERLTALTPGQQQLVALAVGMATMPGLLLADEPTSQLDHRHRDQVLDAIATVNAQVGTTVLLVTHDTEVSERIERRITIRDGRIGSLAHAGEDLAVVGRDGSLQLPPEVLADVPVGSLLRVRLLPNGEIRLQPRSVDSDD